MLSIFSCICWQSVYLLRRNVYLGLLTIFWLGCLIFGYWATWAVCKFWRLIPCQSHHLRILSSVLWVVFLFCCGFLCCAKAFKLIWSHLFIFVFTSVTLGDRSKKILLWFMSNSVLPMFFSKSFILSGLTFRAFEFIFMYSVKECSSFVFLHVAVQFSQHRLLKRLSFLHGSLASFVVD